MIGRGLIGLISASPVFIVLAACDSVGHQASRQPAGSAQEPPGSASGAAPAGPADLGPQPSVLTFVIKQGADPQAVGQRIAGPQASVRQAYQGSHENVPQGTARRTYLVTVPAGQEAEALKRARGDPDVQTASFNLKVPLPAGAGQ